MLWRGWLRSMMMRIDDSSLAMKTIRVLSDDDSGSVLPLLKRRLALKLQRAGLVIDLALGLFLVPILKKDAVLI
jgi:hypothetical protein